MRLSVLSHADNYDNRNRKHALVRISAECSHPSGSGGWMSARDELSRHAAQLALFALRHDAAAPDTPVFDGPPTWHVLASKLLAVFGATDLRVDLLATTDEAGGGTLRDPPAVAHDRDFYQLTDRLRDLAVEVMGHSGDLPEANPQRLEKLVAYLERWLPRTIAEKCERAAAVALEQHQFTTLAERDATIIDLRDQLARETRSSQVASAIADELSAALEKSRDRVAELEGLVEQKSRGLEVAFGAERKLADRVAELEEASAQLREELATRSAQHTRDVNALRDRMADPEGMSHAFRDPGHPDPEMR